MAPQGDGGDPYDHGVAVSSGEHPFAGYLRTIGRGPGRARSLNRAEARDAFAMILNRQVEDVQLGAFLLLQRYRGEGADDLAGFVDATRAVHGWPAITAIPAAEGNDVSAPPSPVVDLDWPSYATTANRDAPWFLAAAVLAVRAGIRILMHGFNGADREAGGEHALAAFGLTAARDLDEARHRIAGGELAYIPLRHLSPALYRLMGLRSLLGLRTPVNTLLKLVNPLAAPASLQGVFHPPYLDLHARTSVLIGQPRSVAFKGGHGEAERNPLKAFTLVRQQGAVITREDWPVLTGDGRGEKIPPRPLSYLLALWNGEIDDPVAVATITGTLAIALSAVDPALPIAVAQQRADALWQAR